jgi:hypothetical protein
MCFRFPYSQQGASQACCPNCTWGSRPEKIKNAKILQGFRHKFRETIFVLYLGIAPQDNKNAKILQGFLRKFRETIFALYLRIAARELGLDNHINPLLMDGFRFRENKYAKILQEFLRKFRETIFAIPGDRGPRAWS